MDFEKLFDKIEFSDIGRREFYEIHKRCESAAFAHTLSMAREEYVKGDEAFGEYLNAFAEREQLPVEVLNLYIYIRMLEDTLEGYRQRGIDEEIFYNTSKGFAVTCRHSYETTGVYGLPQPVYREWMRRNIESRLYRLGLLVFELYDSPADVEIDGYKISKGDPCLSVHIPRYIKLSEEDCEAAYANAREFFKKYYGIEKCFFFCYSWLLYPWLSEALSAESLIVRFQKKFKILKVSDNTNSTAKWIFKKVCENPEDYPEDTSLQRAAKARIKSGMPLGDALGVRL